LKSTNVVKTKLTLVSSWFDKYFLWIFIFLVIPLGVYTSWWTDSIEKERINKLPIFREEGIVTSKQSTWTGYEVAVKLTSMNSGKVIPVPETIFASVRINDPVCVLGKFEQVYGMSQVRDIEVTEGRCLEN
jgi:hypothetical protein